MRKKGPGRAERKGVAVVALGQLFPADPAAARWVEQHRWPTGLPCPACHSTR